MHEQRPLILHVIHHLHMGGMENGLVNLVNRLPESRFRHAIACVDDYSDFHKRLRRRDVEVIALNRSRVGVGPMRRAIFNYCRRLRPALVHSRNLSGLDALLPARLAGVSRCIHGEHGWDVGDLEGRHWKPALLRRLHSPLIDRYVAVSKDIERYLTRRVGISPARITQIYNGVDTERFAPAATKPTSVVPGGLLDDGRFVIGTIGRIQAVKDQATLMRAFAKLLRTRPELALRLRLAIVGDGPLLADLRALVKELAIEGYVWLPGAVDDVPNVLQTFDVFVLPSLAEGISNTILEAMATGLPIIATAVGGNVELVDDGKSGRLFQPRDIATLVRLLANYVDDVQLRAAHARTARRAAVERFGLDDMVNRYCSLYDALCYSAHVDRPQTQRMTG
jgi:sugar transferase (PEP-CTERM/EpsH1 system associated)